MSDNKLHLMALIGRYGDSDIHLEGSAESLRELARTMRVLTGPRVIPLLVPTEPPAPYRGYTASLRVERTNGRVSVSRVAEEIIIRGSPEALTVFARNLEFLAGQKDADSSGRVRPHLHIEYHPGGSYLTEHSTPLVVARSASP